MNEHVSLTRCPMCAGRGVVTRKRNGLTAKDRRCLVVIDQLTSEHRMPPTIRELGAELGIRSTNAVADKLDRLQAAGLIERMPHKSRSVRLTVEGYEELERDA